MQLLHRDVPKWHKFHGNLLFLFLWAQTIQQKLSKALTVGKQIIKGAYIFA